MTVTLEEALKYSTLEVFGFGIGLTFVGLICIIIICAIMGAICKKLIKDTPKTVQPAAQAPVKKAEIANKGEFVAAVAAAIAEDVGTDVSGIKILSIKQK